MSEKLVHGVTEQSVGHEPFLRSPPPGRWKWGRRGMCHLPAEPRLGATELLAVLTATEEG